MTMSRRVIAPGREQEGRDGREQHHDDGEDPRRGRCAPLFSRSAPAADSSGMSSGQASRTGCDSELHGISVSGGAFQRAGEQAAQMTSRAIEQRGRAQRGGYPDRRPDQVDREAGAQQHQEGRGRHVDGMRGDGFAGDPQRPQQDHAGHDEQQSAPSAPGPPTEPCSGVSRASNASPATGTASGWRSQRVLPGRGVPVRSPPKVGLRYGGRYGWAPRSSPACRGSAPCRSCTTATLLLPH